MPHGMDIPTLPKDSKKLCVILDQHVKREERRLAVKKFKWDLARNYADGCRLFKFTAGGAFPKNLGAFHFDEDGNMPLAVSDLLTLANKVHGAFQGMDMSPVALRDTFSLAGMRERAIAQVLASSILSSEQIDEAMSRFSWTFTWLGSCGLQGHTGDFPNLGLGAEIEVVEPMEIFPFPSVERELTKLRGIIRQRMFPLEALREVYGRSINKNINEMRGHIYTRRIGDNTEVDPTRAQLSTSSTIARRAPGIPATGKALGDNYQVALVRELYIYGPRGTCIRYFSCVGSHVLEDTTYDFVQAWCPLVYERFYETGGFRGAGLFDILWSTVREFEKLTEDLINNVKDLDAYPIVIMPAGVINEKHAFRNTGKKMKFLTVDMEPKFGTSGDFRPITVAPHNAGDTPGKVATFLKDVIRDNSPVRDILREKGRVDSRGGLEFLQEQEQKATNTPITNLSRAWGQVYKYCVSQAVTSLINSPRAIPISNITLDLAGVVVDFDAGTVSFKDNPLPDLLQIRFAPRARTLRSPAIRKREALDMASMKADFGQPDWDGLLLLAFDEGLDLAIYSKGEQAAYESVQMNIIRIYGDGQTSGQIVITPHTTRPDLQLRVLEGFMASRIVQVASPNVVNALIDYRETLLFFMQEILPEHVPDPFDAALLDQVRQAQLSQQGQPALPAAPASF